MIKFNDTIEINSIGSKSLKINHLDIIYFDSPFDKIYYCGFRNLICPPVILFKDNTYHENLTATIGQKKLLDLMGDNPKEYLQNLIDKHQNELVNKQTQNSLDLHPDGPGTILHTMLSKLGIKSEPNCNCIAKAHKMNIMGVDWCENNIDTIIKWLKEESIKRKILFVETLAKVLVNRAIKKSRKLQSNDK